MAELFQTTKQNISLHLQNIYAEGELQLEATHKKSLSVRQEGGRSVRRRVDFYNLDAILSVGYRVKSAVATRFRIWATMSSVMTTSTMTTMNPTATTTAATGSVGVIAGVSSRRKRRIELNRVHFRQK